MYVCRAKWHTCSNWINCTTFLIFHLHHLSNFDLHHLSHFDLHHLSHFHLHHLSNFHLHHLSNIHLHHLSNIHLHHLSNLTCTTFLIFTCTTFLKLERWCIKKKKKKNFSLSVDFYLFVASWGGVRYIHEKKSWRQLGWNETSRLASSVCQLRAGHLTMVGLLRQ